MISRRQLIAAAAASTFAGARARAADSFPDHEITFVVPWGAGGSNDILARELQPLLREQGVNIVIENQVGATGAIGLRRVATSKPDGYTLGMGTSSTVAYMAQGKTPLRNSMFTSIARVSTDPLLLLVPGEGPIADLDGFIAFAKAHPDKLSIGTPGTFNLNHIFAAMAARAAGVGFTDVPFTGGAQVITALAGKQIDAGVLKPSESIGQIRSKLVRPIGVFASERLALLPDVPTFKERGFDVFPYGPVVQMAYVVGPAKLPEAVRSRLIGIFSKAIQDPRFKTFAQQNSFLVDDLTGDALDKEVEAVTAAIATVAKQVFKEQG
ncbi:MAG: tripartite tricarboxylate transporter substrate binding protein [Rhizobacter sp.]|nr:tripartite tricarboxylate transporter substrate binding protein [Rhizobacter sp.]